MYHIKALVALLNEDINQYVTGWRKPQGSGRRRAIGELRSISMFILLSALLGWRSPAAPGGTIYRNLGSNLTAISRAMSPAGSGRAERLGAGPAAARRAGELARAFNVSPAIWRQLEHTTRLLKEKTNQMEIDRIKRQELEGGAAA